MIINMYAMHSVNWNAKKKNYNNATETSWLMVIIMICSCKSIFKTIIIIVSEMNIIDYRIKNWRYSLQEKKSTDVHSTKKEWE